MPDRPLRRVSLGLATALAVVLVPASGSSASPAPPQSGPVVTTLAPTVESEVRSTFRRLPTLDLAEVSRLRVAPRDYAAFRLDRGAATAALAPLARAGAGPVRFSVPAPDGSLALFDVVEDSVMEPRLQARHPELRTYAGVGVSDPTATIRLDLTPMGFHATVRDLARHSSWFVDPVRNARGVTTHLSYDRASVPAPSSPLVEDVVHGDHRQGAHRAARAARAPVANGPVTRRSFRLAFVTSPAYASYFGSGNVLAEKVTLVNRVNQIYSDDMAIRFVLVNGTEKLNFDTVEKATTPNGPCGANPCFAEEELDACGGDVLTRNTFAIGQIIGADNYDLGHFGSGAGNGGVAQLGVVGGPDKAAGCTALEPPDGDFYGIDFFAHEVGHQMGGNHTWNGTNGSCSSPLQRNSPTAVEPGSGSSVMAYAGICFNDDLQPHTDPYFSHATITEVTDVVEAEPETVAEQQVVNLRGFVTGSSFALTYEGRSTTITDGDYTAAKLKAKIDALTGKQVTVSGYDGASGVGREGFTVDFTEAAGDVARLEVAGGTGAVTGFTGVIYEGGPGTNGGITDTAANRHPQVTAPASKSLPVQTPFTLTASATDPDPGTELTYLWEQNDPGLDPLNGRLLVDPLKLEGPLFRVFGEAADVSVEDSFEYQSPGQNLADGNPSRTFPDIEQILAGETNAETGTCPPPIGDPTSGLPLDSPALECYSEFLPTVPYGSLNNLNFRVTVRDGFPGGGGTATADVELVLDPAAGPFLVTSRSAAGTPALAVTPEVVSWDVAGTSGAEMAPQVRISLSTDGGRTYPHVLSQSTANDGSESVVLPNVATTAARIKVEAVDNYFFDVNDADFAILANPTQPPPPPAAPLTATEPASRTVQYSDQIAPTTLEASSGGHDGDSLTASIAGVPGLTVSRTTATADGVRPGRATFEVSGTVTDAPGSRTAQVTVREPDTSSASVVKTLNITVTPEDATTAYGGDTEVETDGDTASVVLRTTVTEAADSHGGDVTTASVSFVDREDGRTLCSSPVSGGPAAGTAECTATLAAGPQRGTTSYVVGTVLSGSYARDARGEDATVRVVRSGAPGSVQTQILSGPERYSYLLTGTARFTFASDEQDATFRCRFDSADVPCSDGSAVLRGLGAGMHRFSVTAVSPDGVADRTPARRVFASPFTASSLDQRGTWRTRQDGGAYRGSFLTTDRSGAQLSREVSRVSRVALVVGSGRGFGRVQVLLDGRRLGTVSLAGGGEERRLVPIESFSRPVSGMLRIVTLDDKPVRIEGLGLITRAGGSA